MHQLKRSLLQNSCLWLYLSSFCNVATTFVCDLLFRLPYSNIYLSYLIYLIYYLLCGRLNVYKMSTNNYPATQYAIIGSLFQHLKIKCGSLYYWINYQQCLSRLYYFFQPSSQAGFSIDIWNVCMHTFTNRKD